MKPIKTLVILLCTVCASTQYGSAQNIGINTSGNPAADAAMLDVASTTKGMLIPRVSLTAVGTYAPLTGTPVASLLVYSGTAPTGGGGAGYYYWDGAKWVMLLNGGVGASAWLATGNAGTVDGTNFLGTTDDIPFTIRVNNVRAGRIDNATGATFNTSFGYLAGNAWTGAGVNSTGMGYNALLVNSTGLQNTAVGSGALKSITTNSNSTALGYNALALSTAALNTAVGSEALSTNTSGNGNTAVGGQALKLNTGNNNTAVGQQALATNAGGLENTAMGLSALRFNTYADDNTAIGYRAMELQGTFLNANTHYQAKNTAVGYYALAFNNPTAATNGINNTAIGAEAMYTNLNGAFNVAVGCSTLYFNTRASHNTAVGDLALYSQVYNGGGTVWSTGNVAIGDSALYTNNPTNTTNGYRNTAVGSQALKANTTGSKNTAVGTFALNGITTNGDATAVGYKALYVNTAAGNTAVGSEALSANVGGLFNTAVGVGALKLSTGNQNTGLGTGALTANTSGVGNTALGTGAIATTQTGDYNVGVGLSALNTINGATENTAVGTQAFYTNATGNYNTGLGSAAGFATTGGSNTAIGTHALRYNITGAGNTVVGHEAAYSALTNSQSNNSILGYQAGYALTSGSNNILFGYQAGNAITTGASNIIIGYDVDAPVATNSSQLSIGNLIFATGGFGTGTAIGAGSVGIATNAPGAKLDVNGSIRTGQNATDGQLLLYSEQGATDYTYTFNPNAAATQNQTYTLPPDDGTSGQQLETDGSGNLTWGPAAGSVTGWSILGNSGTVDGTNFIGTTDSKQFNIRVANQKAGRIDHIIFNTFFGYQAGNSTTAGINTGIGAYALFNNTSGTQNMAFGNNSLFTNVSGSNNTAAGVQAMYLNNTGDNNTASGLASLYSNVDGHRNTAIGNYSLYNNVSGSSATAVGYNAMLYANSTASAFENYNVAFGFEALRGSVTAASNTGNWNSAIGYKTLLNNTTGAQNSASGYNALYNNTTGNFNTGNGMNALFYNSTGGENTAIGTNAGIGGSGVSFTQCTFVGSGASITQTRTNVTMIGQGLSDGLCTGNNQVCIGNMSIAAGGLRANVTGWTAYSDARFKTNVKNNVAGLAFILKLKPVTYSVRPRELHKIWGTPDSLLRKMDFSEAEKETRIGFLAQDVEQAAKECGFIFPGVDVPRNDKEVYTLRYVDFIMPLVKGMQEQQEKIESQERLIQQLMKQNEQQALLNQQFSDEIKKIKNQRSATASK